MHHYDFLIVGSGLFGATFAYKALQAGKTCLVIENREHLGGNVYCETIEGINVHKYGAHIFHTNNKEVWDFVNSFVEFNRYTNCPVANYKGELYNLPFNMNTFHQMWGVNTPEEAQSMINEQKAEAIARLNGREPSNLEEQALTLVGKDIFEKLIKEYTEKQWGRDCKDLPAFIIRRLPVRLVYDNNYFNDKYQGIPVGSYNKLIDGLLDGVECRTNTDFFKSVAPETGMPYKDSWKEIADKLVYTGAIDEYFDYRLGELEYRTVKFEHELIEGCENYQGNAVVNYTEREVPYTRIIEHKHFDFGKQADTVISKEYPAAWSKGDEPYYPVNNDRNNELFAKYQELAKSENKVLFGGRLGQYKYYDMDKVIEAALEMVNAEK